MSTAAQQRRFAMFLRVIAILINRFRVGVTTVLTGGTGGTTGTTGTAATPDFSNLAPSLTALQATVARAEQHEQDQVTSMAQTRTDTRDVAPARADVFVHLRSITETAATLRTQVPGIGILKTPKNNLRAASLITEAETFATNAAIYQQVLIDHGQPADFVAQLTEATAVYKAAVAAKGTSLSTQRGATAGIKAEIAVGESIVRQVNANLQRALRGAPSDLAAWNSARRVTLSTSNAAANTTAAEPAPATPATPALPAQSTTPVVANQATPAAQPAAQTGAPEASHVNAA